MTLKEMAFSLKRMLFLLLAVTSLISLVQTDEDCQSNRLVVYKVIFSTYWDRKQFPKQYPEWRPPAQWSKLVGESNISKLETHLLNLQPIIERQLLFQQKQIQRNYKLFTESFICHLKCFNLGNFVIVEFSAGKNWKHFNFRKTNIFS